MNWESLDWEVLDRLRETFLSAARTAGPYWHTITDLECYDFTFGERIGWKWDAVLAELKLRGWSPPPGTTVLDWGCGSGIAGRRVVDFFGAASFSALRLSDHSPLAMDFAEHRARQLFPGLPTGRAATDGPIGVLVISHVLNELDEPARTELRALAARAETILWVEPGTHEVSRALGGWREKLGASLQVVAPCTHRATCGVLAAGNERHWCHFFAAPPAGVYADSGWVKFGQRAGIDLRSLPYSFLVLDRRNITEPAGFARVIGDQPSPRLRPTGPRLDQGAPEKGYARIIGEPRLYKGYAKIFSCAADGVADLTLQKRDAPEIFKALKHASEPMIYRWTRHGDRVSAVEARFP
ncbi:MAG: small ribosomal subunit Rsm22 family protein [Lacunisphaera sp.]|nr:small ribosomal subunit Rsm22 family protein [Lacunisphaera sp.]